LHTGPSLRVKSPFIRLLVQKSVTTITNLAGRLSERMLGKTSEIGNRGDVKSWQSTCQQLFGP